MKAVIPPPAQQLVVSPAGLWIKVCGLTTAEGVEAAVAAGVNAVGFVFHPPSRRCITAQVAGQFAARVPSGILKVAVFLHPEQSAVDEVLAALRPDIVQTDHEDLSGLRIPGGVAVLPVLRSGGMRPTLLPQRVLFEGPISGTGATADWSGAAEMARRCELILAGGLNAGNVADAIRVVHPFGVDVSSGVESAPGIKDPARIDAFVRAARASERAPGAQQ